MGCTPTRHARLPELINGTSRRRNAAAYFADPNDDDRELRISLPSGKCVPKFQWRWLPGSRPRQRQFDKLKYDQRVSSHKYVEWNIGFLVFLISLFTVVMLMTLPAWAQRVVLVPPTENDAILSDAFNRLKAELNIHHFEVQQVDAELGPEPTEALTRIAQEADALASIALLHREGQTIVQIWLVDRVSGKATMRALQVDPGSDAANLLAIRAVNLFRASLREFNPDEKPPADVVNVDRRAVPVVVQKLTERPPPPPPPFALRADAIVLYERPHLGFGLGPAVGGAYRVSGAVELGMMVAGPIVGVEIHHCRRFDDDSPGTRLGGSSLAFDSNTSHDAWPRAHRGGLAP